MKSLSSLQHTAWITKNKMMTTMKGKSVRDDAMMNLAFYLLGNPSICRTHKSCPPTYCCECMQNEREYDNHAEFT